jgi:hypothetical protein
MELVKRIIAPLERDKNTLSIVLVGSASREQMDAFSDLDIHVVVRGERPPDQMFCFEQRLVNINFLDRENRESMLTDPWKALRNIGAAREAQILFDPEDWYSNLQQRARAFVWQNVQAQADISISWVLAENAEEVQKILGGLSNNRLEKVLYALTSLLPNLANVAALANGVLTNSENIFWSSVRDAEPDQLWKELFWTALGFHQESLVTRGQAAVALYARSALLYQDKLLPEHLEIVQHVGTLQKAWT